MINALFETSLNQLAIFFGNNYGWAIVSFTLIIRLAMMPIILPSIKSQRKMLDLKSEVDKLKLKYGHDKKLFQQKQLELYQHHNINPLAGCLPQLVQAALFIAFYRFLITSLNNNSVNNQALSFFWLSLNQPDQTYILPILAALTQFILALMLKPATSTVAEKKLASRTKNTKDDKSAQDMSDMAEIMQSQTLILMPLLIGFFAINLPSGLSLYWIASSIFSIVQQYYSTGLGGLDPYFAKLKNYHHSRKDLL